MKRPAASLFLSRQFAFSLAAGLFLSALVGLALWACVQAWQASAADAQTMAARSQLRRLHGQTSTLLTLSQWNRTHEALTAGLVINPHDAQSHLSLSYLYFVQSQWLADQPSGKAEAEASMRLHTLQAYLKRPLLVQESKVP